jgi:hypothetical protein
MLCEYCQLALETSQRENPRVNRLHDKCRVTFNVHVEEQRCTCFCNSHVLRTEL